ncbi:MAG: UvrD-helicase domain-containing protein [Rhabdochlamydiaceae bacterium]
MKSFNVMDRTLNIQDSYILEASAGTGKTFCIEHLVVRLILEGAISISKILVVTFTKAAVKELKERIRKNIQKCLEAFSKEDSTTFILYDYLEPWRLKNKENAVRALQTALVNFENASIFTIHGFCFRLLKEYPVESNLYFHTKNPEEEINTFPNIEVIVDLLKIYWTKNPTNPKYLSFLMKAYNDDIYEIARHIFDILSKRKTIPTILSFKEAFEEIQLKLARIIKNPEDLSSEYSLVTKNFRGFASKKAIQTIDLIQKLALRGDNIADLFEEFIFLAPSFLEKLELSNLKAKGHFPHIPTYNGIKNEILPILRQLLNPSAQLLKISKDIADDYYTIVEKKNLFSPDDLIYKVENLCSSDNFLDLIQHQFEALIVDEFQDTDKQQWSIFKKFFLNNIHLKALYLVGDPKQSIYKFRGADMYTYIDAVDQVGRDRVFVLDTNFRSEPSFIKTLNTLFYKEDQTSCFHLPAIKNSLTYKPVKSSENKKDHAFMDDRGSFHFFILEIDEKKEKNIPSKQLEENRLFPFILQEIYNLKNKSQMRMKDMAVLVKDRYQAQRLQKFFKSFNVDSFVYKSESLLSSQAFLSFYELVLYLNDQRDLSLLKKVLTGPFFRLKINELIEDESNAKTKKGQITLNDILEVFQEKGFSHFIKTLFKASIENISCIENILSHEDSSFYFDFRKVITLVFNYECKYYDQPFNLLRCLEELKKNEQTIQYENESIKASEEEICIITTHMSKGLEFDIVFALGTSSRTNSFDKLAVHNDTFIFYDEEDKDYQEHLEEINAEKLRQLYVAYTRARKRLYIPVFTGSCEDISKMTVSPLELFLDYLNVGCSKEKVIDFVERLKQTCSISCSLVDIKPNLSHLKIDHERIENETPNIQEIHVKPQRIFSFSSLAKPFNKSIVAEASIIPSGREVGHLLHLILDKIFSSGLNTISQKEKRQDLIDKTLTDTILNAYKEHVYEMLEKVLNMNLIDGFALNFLAKENVLSESTFIYSYGENLMKGTADLIFYHEEKYYLLDWKSNLLADYKIDTIEKEMLAHDYFLQASIYTEALERYVKLFDNRPFKDVFGGCLYIFLRAPYAYHFFPKGR